jgi:hypothetical protein
MMRLAVSHAGQIAAENNSARGFTVASARGLLAALLLITKNSGRCPAAMNVSRVQLPGSGATFSILLHFYRILEFSRSSRRGSGQTAFPAWPSGARALLAGHGSAATRRTHRTDKSL